MPNWIERNNFQSVMNNDQLEELRRKLDVRKNQRIVLFVHRLSKRKGAHWIPEIVEQLPNNAMLVVIGDGPEMANIKRQIAQTESEGKVRLLGWIAQHEVSMYYALADLFILPSEEEGFPHVLLEAMASGTPFVATEVGGVRDMIPEERYTWITPKEDKAAFIRKLGELIQNVHGKDPLLREWVEQYSLANVVKIFHTIVS